MKKEIRLTQDANVGTGEYRMSTEDGRPSIYVAGIEGADYYDAYAEDEDGNEYYVIWWTNDDFDPAETDESSACDWENPTYVEFDGKDVTSKVKLVENEYLGYGY